MTRALLVVGQSHVAALRDAARLAREADPAAPRTRVIHTREPQWAPELVDTADGPRLAPALADAVREQITRHHALLVSAAGGNVHMVLGLMRHPRPFDYRLSGEPSPPLDPAAELLPESLVEATLAFEMARDLDRLRALAALGIPLVHLESPPPVASEAFIADAADAWFRDNGIAHRGVAPAGLRYRLWRLASRIVRRETERLGQRFLPVPARALDEAGFLRLPLAADATHGNARYGALLIEALGG